MVPSILRDTTVSLHDVEAELQALASPRKSAARNLAIVLGSLLLFVLVGAVSAGPLGILVVVAVLLIHELGHLAAMKAFGYRDVQMFFIPLFGAAVSGTETSPSGVKRAIVSLCGPAPGIALGIICATLFLATGQRAFMVGARTFLILNTFSLLPLVPLDGGHYVEAILFSRTPILRVLSIVGAGVVLALVAIVARDVVFGIIAVLVLASVRNAYFSGKLAAQIKRELAEQGEADSVVGDRVPSQYIERLIPLVQPRLPERMWIAPGIAAAVRNIWNMVWFKPPSALASAGLLLLYLVCFGTGIVATISAEMSFQKAARSQSRESGPVGAGASNEPALSARCAQGLDDDTQAVACYRKAAEQGDAAAQYSLGVAYLNGQGVPQDSAQAVAWYRRAAEQGYAAGQFDLGVMYANGQGVPHNSVQAVAWYRKAAEQGFAAAQYNLALMYTNGQGVPQDYAQALTWYRKAAEQGFAEAQSNLGVMYANGQGAPRDSVQDLAWYRKAAEQGFAAAQCNLGSMYEHGQGVPRDDTQAVAWHRKAAEQGDAEAQHNLGVAYWNGRGVPQDYIEAHKWLNLGAARTSGDQQKKSAASRDALAQKMTPAQIAEAQKRASEWMAAFKKRKM